jgi:hypothetical protein
MVRLSAGSGQTERVDGMPNLYNQLLSADDERASLRRRDERHLTRVKALLHCHGRFQTVLIVDYSLGGLQLQGCFGVGIGDEITVELLTGQHLPAKVAWSVGSRIGVRFVERLEQDHPALAVLQRAAKRVLGRAQPAPPQPQSDNG